MVFSVGPIIILILLFIFFRIFKLTRKKIGLNQSVRNSKSIRQCEKCQNANSFAASFCSSCGSELPEAVVVNSVSKSFSSKVLLLALMTTLLIAGGYFYITKNRSVENDGYGADGGISLTACDYVSEALNYHDPRMYKMATEEEANAYKENMATAADIFRQAASDEGSSYFAQLASISSQMSNGMKGIAEDGSFPVLDFCGL